jgi:hypothetical protein
MSSIFDNPSFYISIFSSVCFIASEILPFLPVKGNGIFHAIVECLSKYKDKSTTDNPLNQNKIENKLDQVIEKLDKIEGSI